MVKIISLLCCLLSMGVVCFGQAEIKEKLFYDAKWYMVETKAEASFYRVFNVDDDGKPLGVIYDYYISGELQGTADGAISIDKYDDSKSVFTGKVIGYEKNGTKKSESIHNMKGVVVQNSEFYANGQKNVSFKLVNGVPDGDMLFFSEKGNKIALRKYIKGDLLCETGFTDSGEVSYVSNFKNNKLNGVSTNYYYSGWCKRTEVIYENDKPKHDWYLVYDKQDKSYKYDFKTKKPYSPCVDSFFKDGKTYQFFDHKGVKITMHLSIEKNYGKYYIAYIYLDNLTGKSFNFYPENISVKFLKNKNEKDGVVLTSSEYMRKVRHRQSWNAALLAFGESYNANQAGYSSSNTSSNTNYSSNTYSSTYGASSTYANASTNSTTQSYNGAVAYIAQQNAQNNINKYNNYQYQIKNSLNQGYLKRNTLYNEQRIYGQINIKYKNADKIKIVVPVNGTNYEFWWNNK